MKSTAALLYSVFKLRIGMAIALSALAGLAVTPGPSLPGWKIVILGLSVLAAPAAAGAFNQYAERDLDARMKRTRNRPFVTGRFSVGTAWLAGIVSLLAVAVVAAAVTLNAVSALCVLLGAVVYGVVYTLWLKRRTSLNIVIGGLAGKFRRARGRDRRRPFSGPGAMDPCRRAVPLDTPPFLEPGDGPPSGLRTGRGSDASRCRGRYPGGMDYSRPYSRARGCLPSTDDVRHGMDLRRACSRRRCVVHLCEHPPRSRSSARQGNEGVLCVSRATRPRPDGSDS